MKTNLFLEFSDNVVFSHEGGGFCIWLKKLISETPGRVLF